MVIIFIIQIPLPLTTTQTDQFVEIAKSKKYSALDKYSTVPEKMMSAKLASVSLLHYTVWAVCGSFLLSENCFYSLSDNLQDN